jgi:prolyl-tRNA synthetase
VEGGEDQNGLRWNSALSPMDAVVVPLNQTDELVVAQAQNLYEKLQQAGFRVLIDDRDASPGVKLKDADLLGFPVQVVISPRNLTKGVVEMKNRWTGDRLFVAPADVEENARAFLEGCLPQIG